MDQCKHINEKLQKTGAQPEMFQCRGGFMEHFIKSKRKKGPAGINFGVFFP